MHWPTRYTPNSEPGARMPRGVLARASAVVAVPPRLSVNGVLGGGGVVTGPTTQSVAGGGSEGSGAAGALSLGPSSGAKIRGSSLSFTAHRSQSRDANFPPARAARRVVLSGESSKGDTPMLV